MQFVEMGNPSGKTLMLLPGTACDYQTNFAAVLDRLGEKYHLICVNYDGFDGSDAVFPDMITVTEKIEEYIKENYNGKIDGAIGSSLGSSFVGQLIQRENIHLDHGIFGSPDLDQSGKLSAWLQSKLVVPLLTGFTKNEKKRTKTRESIALIVRMISRNQRAVDEATSWLKRIVVAWIILNSLGFVVAYLQPLVAGGQYTG